jgi:hypothetical protein
MCILFYHSQRKLYGLYRQKILEDGELTDDLVLMLGDDALMDYDGTVVPAQFCRLHGSTVKRRSKRDSGAFYFFGATVPLPSLALDA